VILPQLNLTKLKLKYLKSGFKCKKRYINTVVIGVLRLRIAAPSNICQSMYLVGASMGSNPIRSHFCWHTPEVVLSLWRSSVFFFR